MVNSSTEYSESSLPAMHVCYLNPGNQSGYETRVIEETALLTKLGRPVIIACFIHNNQKLPLSRLWKFHKRLKKSTNAKIYIIPTSAYFDISDKPENTKWITSFLVLLARLHRVKIMHGQALYSTMHILRARRKINVQVVFDVHGASPEEGEMSGAHENRVNRLTEWEKKALTSADLRLFVSNQMRNFFEEKYLLSDLRHTVIPCCVHTDRFRMSTETRKSKRRALGIDDRFVIMYLGTLSVWQWPEAMFSLFAQFHDQNPESFLYLLLPESDHEKAKTLLEESNIPLSSFKIEEVPHTEVGSVIGMADAGLLLRKHHPVNYVASPTKFGEYIAAGIPVITTKGIGDTSSMISKEKVGIILNST